MILASSWSNKLHPRLAALEEVLGSRQAVVAAVSKAPPLLGSALDTFDSNLRVLQAAGLSPDEVRCCISKQPQLFYRAFASPEFRSKLCCFNKVLGIAPRRLFVERPSYLQSSLRRIDYRVSKFLNIHLMMRSEASFTPGAPLVGHHAWLALGVLCM